MLCEKQEQQGRRFVGGGGAADEFAADMADVRNTKVRIVCVQESILMKIRDGNIVPPPRWQNARHEGRWNTMALMAELFRRQHEDPANSSKHLLRLCITAPVPPSYATASSAADAWRSTQRDVKTPSNSHHRGGRHYTDHPLVKARMDPR